MYLLYLDETIDNHNGLEGIGAVLITDRRCRKFYSDFNKLLSILKIEKFEIHADHIWNARGDFEKFSMEDRANISLQVAKFLKDSGIAKFIYIQRDITGKNKDSIYIESLELIIDKAVKYVKQNGGKSNKQLMLIFDKREDINEDIFEELLKQHQRIIEKHKTSFFFLDCGYEGISKYSRLLQSADFVAYWCRLMYVSQPNPSLFKNADNPRKVELVEKIKNLWKQKLILIK